MQTTPPRQSIEELLAHSKWVKQLVGGLVLDPGRADDVLQETWLAALKRPPQTDTDLRAWLATVAKNAVRQFGRSESRRTLREQAAARLEVLPDVVDSRERARLQRRLVDAVLALDEPYSTTLLLRYFDELPPREIAKRLDRPVNTVRTHLERGLTRLRSSLDAEYGDREAWGFAFLPLCFDRTALATSGSLLLKTGGILMLCKYVLPATVVLFLITAWIASDAEPTESLDRAARETELLRASAVVDPVTSVPEVPTSAERESLFIAHKLPTRSATNELHTYAGLVLDLAGRPLVGVELLVADPERPRYRAGELFVGGRRITFGAEELEALRRDPELVRERVPELADPRDFEHLVAGHEIGVYPVSTSSDGRFAIDIDFELGKLSAADPARVLLGRGSRRVSGGTSENVYVVTQRAVLRGRVVDEFGDGIEGARVWSMLRMERLPAFPLILEETESFECVWATESDSDGGFEMWSTPVAPGMLLRVEAQGFEVFGRTLEADDRGDLLLVLRTAAERRFIAGRVIDHSGREAVNVPIFLDSRESLTDERGRFYFEVAQLDSNSILTAYRPGFTPAILDDLHARIEADPLSCRELLLELGRPTGVIEGRVVDGAGNGLNGVLIFIADGPRNARSSDPLEGALSKTWRGALQTDANGRFVLDGLYRPTCDLVFENFSTGATLRRDAVAVGTADMQIVMDDSMLIGELRGRVLDRRGRPVVGAELSSSFTIWNSDGSNGRGRSHHPKGETDENGEFVLRRVAFGNSKLLVGGTGIDDTEFELDPGQTRDLTFVVPLRLRFQLDADIAPSATSFEIFDMAGARLDFKAIYADRDIYASISSLEHRDALPTFEVSDEAHEIVLSAGGVEVERKPLLLKRGEVVQIR